MKNMNNAEKNSYVRKHITSTLIGMMKKQNLTEISVRDLCSEAGVGRASFYRNYGTKDDVLTAYITAEWRKYEKAHDLKKHRINDVYRVQRYFEFCLSMRELNDILLLQEQTAPILKAYETILSDLDQGVPRESFESFYMAYGLFGIFLKWAKGGYSETPAEMTKIVTDRIFKDYRVDTL